MDAQIDYQRLPNTPRRNERMLFQLLSLAPVCIFIIIAERTVKGDCYLKNNMAHNINKNKEVKFTKKEEKFLLGN